MDVGEQPRKPPISQDAAKDHDTTRKHVSLRSRLEHFTWANFTCTQSTGGIAILLSETPHQFHGLQTAGAVIFIFNIALFIFFCTLMTLRFKLHPHTFKKSLLRPPELYFANSFFLSIATMIICIDRFGVPHAGPWLLVVVRVLFWIYAAVTLLYMTTMFVVGFAKSNVNPLNIHPAVFLMVFSAMLTGTVSGSIAEAQPPAQRLPIIVAGVAYQGLGWVLSLILLPWFIGRMFNSGLGPASTRPGMFMPVGTAGYTVVSLIGCSRALPAGYAYFRTHPIAIEVLQVVALWASIFIWLVAFWVAAMAIVACIPTILPQVKGWRVRPRMGFILSWWAIIFPNVGFTIGTGFIGQELESPAIQWVATAMTIILFAAWLMDLVLHLKAMLTGQIMWPGKDEDAFK